MNEVFEGVMWVNRFIILVLLFIASVLATANVVQYIRAEKLERHIEVLEKYIADNEWPTPAFNIRIGK
jgi:hypothetical protein